MYRRILPLVLSVLVVAAPSTASPSASASAPQVSRLSAVRAASHSGFDRVVFQFAGALPASRSVNWVSQVVQDASGKVMHIPGEAFLRVVFKPATAHSAAGQRTYSGTLPISVNLRLLRSVTLAGDYEAVLSFGIGLRQKVPFHMINLSGPARLAIDFSVPRA